jgi:hypothetical protein
VAVVERKECFHARCSGTSGYDRIVGLPADDLVSWRQGKQLTIALSVQGNDFAASEIYLQ